MLPKRYFSYEYTCPKCKIRVMDSKLPIPKQCAHCSSLLYPRPRVTKSESPVTPMREVMNEEKNRKV